MEIINILLFILVFVIGCIFYWYIGLAISAVIEINKKMDLILYELRRARKDKE